MIQRYFLLFFVVFSLTFSSYAQECTKVINVGDKQIAALSIHPNSKYVAVADWSLDVKVYDLLSGKLYKKFPGHTGIIQAVAFSPDGRHVASAGWDHTVKVWSFESGKLILNLEEHEDNINALMFSPDGLMLASAGDDKKIILWDLASGKVKKVLQGHTETVYNLDFSKDGQWLSSASWDKTAIIWDVSLGQIQSRLEGHIHGVYDAPMSPDEVMIATASEDHTIKLWLAPNGELQHTFARTLNGVIRCLSFSNNGELIASGSLDNTISLWNIAKENWLRNLEGHSGGIVCLSFSPDGEILVSGSEDGTIRIWDMTDYKYAQCVEEKLMSYEHLARPKGEFETTQQYNERKAQYVKIKSGLKAECQLEEQSFRQNLVKESLEWVYFKAENLSNYNADKMEYTITVRQGNYTLKMPIDEAKSFKNTWSRAKVKAIKHYNPEVFSEEILNMVVVHPVSKKEYPIGTQVEPSSIEGMEEFIKGGH